MGNLSNFCCLATYLSSILYQILVDCLPLCTLVFYDFETPARGSRNWSWYKNSSIWEYFASYFPLKLVKTSELPTDRNYIMGCHPHGILSIGAFTHLSTSATGFSEKFPGIKSNILTLNGQFWFPFRREIGIGLGGVECSSKSLKFLLKNPKGGALAGIVIGGAEELLDAKPGNFDLNILGRLGFCRIALETGASLVPSFSFGENDVYDQYTYPRDSRPRKIQRFIKKCFGVCFPLLFGYSWYLPLMPKEEADNNCYRNPHQCGTNYSPYKRTNS
ncbi:Diacylglycerol acyltransferase [Meloidogyne graminicola]|uniref:Diacylglycerol acyltransferase n=1 Tax=Meloidogyne graminicola TaxID=189291 RepID=A0A8S9ZNA2_9BILA|nr:Diacylglycerol acyltransferase [Meloidogyne graminicola]